MGDILTAAAKDLDLAGTVIDGCCRDVDLIRKLQYPVFSLGIFMLTGKDQTQGRLSLSPKPLLGPAEKNNREDPLRPHTKEKNHVSKAGNGFWLCCQD
jgi:hypothetical protein